MPFTPTHVLAIVPVAALRRQPFPLSALVIGSMIPDLPLFTSLAPAYGVTHSARGLLVACLPLGLAAFVVFRAAARGPLLALMPAIVRRRCAHDEGARLSLATLAWAAAAVVLGAGTHVVWDAFTHAGGWGTQAVPALREQLHVAGHAVRGYKIAQYGSSLVGLPLLALAIAAWLRAPRAVREAPPSPLGRGRRIAIVLTTGCAAVAAGVAAVWLAEPGARGRVLLALSASAHTLLAATLLYCVAYHLWAPRPRALPERVLP